MPDTFSDRNGNNPIAPLQQLGTESPDQYDAYLESAVDRSWVQEQAPHEFAHELGSEDSIGHGDDSEHQELFEDVTVDATEDQFQAITSTAEPNTVLSIRAGPGKGKTHTLVNRIAYLVTNCGFKPHEIVVLSMANRSVKLLKINLVKTVGEELAAKFQLSTFHSFCGTMLELHGDQYSDQFNQRRLMDDASWRAFATLFLRKSIRINGNSINSEITAVSLQRLLTNIKSGKLTVEEACKKNKVDRDYVLLLLEYLESNGMMMYLDLINNFLKMVEMSLQDGMPRIPALSKYKVVVVDEFQDMYPELLDIVTLIVSYPTESSLGSEDLNSEPESSVNSKKKHLTVAGDPHQSIYGFLGSDPSLMLDVTSHIPEHDSFKEILLKEIFRSTSQIINLADAVSLKSLELSSDNEGEVNVFAKEDGHKPVIYNSISSDEEHFFIAREITRLICELGGLLRPSDFVILTRTNQELEHINRMLSESYDYKCNKLSSTVMWTYSRLLLFINILLVIQNRENRRSNFPMLCLLQVLDPKGGKRISAIFNKVNNNESVELYFLLSDNESELKKLYKSNPNKLLEIREFLKNIQNERNSLLEIQVEEQNITPAVLLKSLHDICEKADFLPYINGQEDLGVYLDSFNRSLHYSFSNYIDQQSQEVFKEKAATFLEYFIRNYAEQVPIIDKDMINLSTIHAAKGLEFPVVFVTGSSKLFFEKLNYWDSLLYGKEEFQPDTINKEISEKARLFYVASTRAKYLLYIGTIKNNLASENEWYDKLHLNIRKHFSMELPSLIDETGNETVLLDRIATDLPRSLPLKQKFVDGQMIFNKFKHEYRAPQPKLKYTNVHTRSDASTQVFKRAFHSLSRCIRRGI